jgi:hypothetical protein
MIICHLRQPQLSSVRETTAVHEVEVASRKPQGLIRLNEFGNGRATYWLQSELGLTAPEAAFPNLRVHLCAARPAPKIQ